MIFLSIKLYLFKSLIDRDHYIWSTLSIVQIDKAITMIYIESWTFLIGLFELGVEQI